MGHDTEFKPPPLGGSMGVPADQPGERWGSNDEAAWAVPEKWIVAALPGAVTVTPITTAMAATAKPTRLVHRVAHTVTGAPKNSLHWTEVVHRMLLHPSS